jgi:hypothetical protein
MTDEPPGDHSSKNTYSRRAKREVRDDMRSFQSAGRSAGDLSMRGNR